MPLYSVGPWPLSENWVTHTTGMALAVDLQTVHESPNCGLSRNN